MMSDVIRIVRLPRGQAPPLPPPLDGGGKLLPPNRDESQYGVARYWVGKGWGGG